MNQDNCPPALATDELIVDQLTVPSTCNTNVPVFAAWFSILCLSKTVTAVGLSVDWYLRYRSHNARYRAVREDHSVREKRMRRLPVVPVLTILQAASMTLLLITSSINQCSSRSGCFFAGHCVIFALFQLYGILFLKQFIGLGRRMIPLARSKMEEQASHMSSSSSENPSSLLHSNIQSTADALAKEDRALRILVGTEYLTVALQCCFGIAVQLTQSRQDFVLWFRLAVGFQTLYFFTSMLAFDVQIQRLKNATRIGCAKPHSPDIMRALQKMRQTQATFTVMHFGGGMIALLLTSGVLLPQWFVLMAWYTLESTAAVFSFVKFSLPRMMKRTRGNTKHGDAGGSTLTQDKHHVKATFGSSVDVLAGTEALGNAKAVRGQKGTVVVVSNGSTFEGDAT